MAEGKKTFQLTSCSQHGLVVWEREGFATGRKQQVAHLEKPSFRTGFTTVANLSTTEKSPTWTAEKEASQSESDEIM